MKYVYDTNIFIYYLADDITVNSWFTEEFLNLHEILVSPIIRIELLSFVGLSKEEQQSIEDLLSQFNTVSLLREIENQTIQIKRQYKIKLPDAIIAATAINQDAFLVTRNVGDFKGITGLKIENPFVS
ncbi:type II toxin-antitoxin system VapC family toxin [Dolichospermum sp. LEGE 00240]|uniref:type II toxin-antitoxin system VapC family toxin n=1 Tax=Dolichospermum sp. LEGE 00240 TaxID=1828603 RepID=UPI00187E1316|nr:type II toxin-antitoxin system VapC family toxin [Dolichospermum sp. LEGE 00240]MDM3845167.1 type II toxin-antitoxin system VapC family toxin [Aphanizomenon gracile PMC638.10]MDM3852440.1 type II toxin-antitoxin system VapC family toxin [Aphanizomenon gracile PMC627.10]MDM3857066.1 type II toxin-antitoxin system VapC family toxin [Aphanizomenon gracile PMC649.10]MDM3858649.1 type II toxin-antitoxin system VapC family toxin [Aphanizomenon gracile PMC644.10]MBE9250359.1 type II toxin-antitoxi